MPKLIGHTPPWLSHPSPGARIFSDPESQSPVSPSKKFTAVKSENGEDQVNGLPAARKTVALRGTEVFTVVGNKIRWADLNAVHDEWDSQNHQKPPTSSDEKRPYRSLKTPVYYQITGLSVSPSGHFLAISTDHTVHIALLPDSSRLHDGDQSEIKLKAYQLGPTTHVIPEAPLVAVLWHPLAASSPSTDCLVTVTSESAVRVWEFDRTNHWSFERPALAIDLRKLADGTSSDQEFEPSGFGKSRGFSADAFDMEAAAARWGGKAAENEDPWAATTLWTTMTNGDVYALCPLLPSKWRPAATTIPALTTSTVSRLASIEGDDVDPDEKRAAQQAYEWVQEIDSAETQSPASVDDSVLPRPSNPSAIPRLQGPFEIPVENLDDDTEVVDILVIPANLDEDDLFSGEDDYDTLGGSKSLPFTIICLTTTDSRLHVMIEVEGVMGQWLPPRGRAHFSVPTSDAGEFVLVESVSLQDAGAPATTRPMFTLDSSAPYTFLVTTGYTVFSISLEDWASRVGLEVSEDDTDEIDTGLDRRLALACRDEICKKTSLISAGSITAANGSSLSTATIITSVTLGTLILTTSDSRAVAVQLDQTPLRTSQLLTNEPSFSTSTQSAFRASRNATRIDSPPSPIPQQPTTRAPYAPSQVFYNPTNSKITALKSNLPSHRRHILKERPLRLSPACLDIMAYAHRAFSHQTSDIEKAAAELFRRCARLREDLNHQVQQMAELAERLGRINEDVNDLDNDKAKDQSHEQIISTRINDAKARQEELFRRYERVRRKAATANHGKTDLSIKEKAWIQEINGLSQRVGIDAEEVRQTPSSDTETQLLTTRLTNAQSLTQDLIAEAKRIKESTTKTSADSPGGGSTTPEGKMRTRLGAGGGYMSRFQRERIKEVMDMVEREGAIIEAVQGRLGKLELETGTGVGKGG